MNNQPIRILLVEDDPGDARLLREMLADAGTMRSELVWSTQLGEALQRLSAESFDVILLDLSLADCQGWGTFDKMHGHTAHVPVVVLTGLDDEALAVRDTGCGINPQGTRKIFERLYQEANASDASRKGLGLGLYICHELVAAHVGHIWVESQLGQGSTFFFTLPVFPLVRLLSPIIKAHNWQTEGLVLITIEFCFQRRALPTLMRETLLRQAWQGLQHCTLHECLVLLPRMASLEAHELFFGVACVDQHGAEQIAQPIRARPEFSSNLVGPDVEIQVSTMTIETPPESQEFPKALVNTIASRIEGLKHRAV
jgi:CheY-like chemotaxis protein